MKRTTKFSVLEYAIALDKVLRVRVLEVHMYYCTFNREHLFRSNNFIAPQPVFFLPRQ